MKNIADQAFLRESNLSAVLRMIHGEAPLSRAQLATAIGLNKSTVSSLVEELLDRGLIREIGLNSIGAGRPATLLGINARAGAIIGIEFGVDFVLVTLADFVGKILWRRTIQTNQAEEQQTTLAQTQDLVSEAISTAYGMGLRLLGIGLATPGTVDLNEGILIFAPNLHWRNVPLRQIFSDSTGLRVLIENDANAATVGEHLFGATRQSDDFIFVFAGVGIGGGLFLNGQLYRGSNGYAGEIGHAPIKSDDISAPCFCGNRGCWELHASQYSILQRVQENLETKRNGVISQLMEKHNVPLSISIIKQAADLGDSTALDSFSEAGRSMGLGIAGLVNIFNPEKIVLGGPLSIAGDYLLPAIRESVSEHALPETNQQVEVVLSAFGPDASVIGAISLMVDYILSNPNYVEKEVMFQGTNRYKEADQIS